MTATQTKHKTVMRDMRNGRVCFRMWTVTCGNCGHEHVYTPLPKEVMVRCRECRHGITVGRVDRIV